MAEDDVAQESAAGYLAGHIDAMRGHIAALAAAAPGLPGELASAGEALEREWQARGPGSVLLLIAGFIALGLALEAAFRRASAGVSFPAGGVGERLRSIGLRFAIELGAIAAFALGSAATFLALDWPARTREAVIAALLAALGARLAVLASRALLSPGAASLRVIPASDAGARFVHRRVALFAAWLACGWVIIAWLKLLGMPRAALDLVAYTLGIVLMAIAAETLWRRSRLAAGVPALLWALWAAQAWGLFWLAALAATLRPVLRLAQAAAEHVLRPAAAEAPGERAVMAAALGRGLRALLIIAAAYLLVHAFALDVDELAAGGDAWARLARGAVHALVIVLVADAAWKIVASLIDRGLSAARAAASQAEGDAGHRRARLLTLLPIVRSTVLAVLVVMTVLTALSALGVEVAPLLAGAGVVGLAVGFGAQTLVRDMFSKFFYLLDDAFRVGEYIQSGSYKGTVEHLGVRSVRLRHHRGALYTIPYGLLGAVQNMSRDWVIDKLTVALAYDADLDKAKQLIKRIGKALAADPELAPSILEPLKMQGVENFADFGVHVRMKMKTRPGEQFAIRRRAHAMIKAAFDECGIRFAHPTVQVAGGDEVAAAAAARSLGARRNRAP